VDKVIDNFDSLLKAAKLDANSGALGGLVKGARATKIERMRIVKNCLRNRDYVVLN